jgi:hypothetical protein
MKIYSTPKSIADIEDRIVRLYQEGVSISQLAIRFHLTNQGIRYVLTKRKVLRYTLKRKNPACGMNVSPN